MSFVTVRVADIKLKKDQVSTAERVAKLFGTYVDGWTEGYNTTTGNRLKPAELLNWFLDNGKSFKELATENPEESTKGKYAVLQQFSKTPGFKYGYKLMTPRWAKWFTYKILPKYRSDLAKVIIEHSKGEEWMQSFVLELRRQIWSK